MNIYASLATFVTNFGEKHITNLDKIFDSFSIIWTILIEKVTLIDWKIGIINILID